VTVRPIPPEAIKALEAIRRERAALPPMARGQVVLRIDEAPGAPRPVEWSVLVDGVVYASSQPYLVGRRRGA